MRILIGAALLAATAACSSKDLNIGNPNNPTVAAAAGDPAALQLLTTGLIQAWRGSRTVTGQGILGRESYTFTPTEGRNTTHFLIGIVVNGAQKLDPTGFATGPWGGPYGTLRNIYNYKTAVNAGSLTAQQKSAALGLAKLLEAEMLLQIAWAHDTLGGIVQINANANVLAPFVARDSLYKYIMASYDSSITALGAGGAAFPFTLHAGFAGFNTPATMIPLANALKAKAATYYATAGGGAAQWQNALTALAGSFLNAGATTRAALDAGPFHIYSTAAGDATNGLDPVTNTNLYAHMSFQTDAQNKADGTPDNRYLAKINTGLPSRQGPISGGQPTSAASTLGFKIYPTNTTPIAIIRNEELILIRAEARLATGDKAGAIADLNQVRTNSGGLPPSTLTAASSTDDILTGILYEKRYSTMLENTRWIDMRRYGKLNLLPLDVPSGPNKNFVATVYPVIQAECLTRASATGIFRGPNGLDDCAP
jgi:hypothetical protein